MSSSVFDPVEDDEKKDEPAEPTCLSACATPLLLLYVFYVLLFWGMVVAKAAERNDQGPWDTLTSCSQHSYGFCVMFFLAVPLYLLLTFMLASFLLLWLFLCPVIMGWTLVEYLRSYCDGVNKEETMGLEEEGVPILL